jgi:ankyrin repeat protein
MNQLVHSGLVRAVAAALLFVSGCAERSPQQQLIPAVLDGDIAKVNMLLDNQAEVDIDWRAGGDGTTALATAAGHNKLEIAQLLLRRGADPNIPGALGVPPLLAATSAGSEEIVQLLLDAGADPNVSEARFGFSPLADAARNGYTEIARILLDAGADRYAKVKNGRTPADIARQSGHLQTLQLLHSYWPRTGPQQTE